MFNDLVDRENKEDWYEAATESIIMVIENYTWTLLVIPLGKRVIDIKIL